MRTVDILVTGLFSPAAVAAVGIADLYARFFYVSDKVSGLERSHFPVKTPVEGRH